MFYLMAARLEQQRVEVSSLCIAAAVPPTTALRWIKALSDAGPVRAGRQSGGRAAGVYRASRQEHGGAGELFAGGAAAFAGGDLS